MRKIPKIIVIGSYAVGMTMTTSRLPKQGETVTGKNFTQIPGGKGSNQAICARRMGADVMFFTHVGNDDMGKGALQMYKDEGIDASRVILSDKAATGVGFVVVDEEGNNGIVIDLGANLEVRNDDIEKLRGEIASCDAMLLQNEITMDAVKYAIKVGREENVTVILDPGPYQPIEDEYLQMVDYLVPNDTEARELLNSADRNDITIEEVATRLRNKGIKNLIITLGDDGCLLADDNGFTKFEAEKVQAVDSTGAGDTFSGAFAVALAEGMSLADAIGLAGKAAAMSVTKYGVVDSIPFRQDVEKMI